MSIDPRWTSHDSGHGGDDMKPSEPMLEVNGLSAGAGVGPGAGAGAGASAGADIDAHPLTLDNGLGALEMPTPSPRFEPVKTVRVRGCGYECGDGYEFANINRARVTSRHRLNHNGSPSPHALARPHRTDQVQTRGGGECDGVKGGQEEGGPWQVPYPVEGQGADCPLRFDQHHALIPSTAWSCPRSAGKGSGRRLHRTARITACQA